jgi:hypothetical protein
MIDKMTTVFIDEYGHVVPEQDSTHKVTLQGSYKWSYLYGGWQYDVKKVEPALPLTKLFSREKLIKD